MHQDAPRSCRGKKSNGLDRQVDLLDRTVKDQTKSLPVVLAETLSEMQRERDGR